MLKQLAISLVIASACTSAFAQTITDIAARTGNSAYVQDGRGVVTRSANGLCWRTGYWTPADAVTGCDGELAPPFAKAIAPAIVAAPEPVPAPAPIVQARCDFAATFAAEQNFEFDRAELTNIAKKRIDEEIINKLVSCNKVDIIVVTGHTDRLGSQQYNQKLSDRRAEAVSTYIKSKNVSAPVDTVGAGETQPVKSCNDKMARNKLIVCLAPNRRVVIEVRGHAN